MVYDLLNLQSLSILGQRKSVFEWNAVAVYQVFLLISVMGMEERGSFIFVCANETDFFTWMFDARNRYYKFWTHLDEYQWISRSVTQFFSISKMFCFQLFFPKHLRNLMTWICFYSWHFFVVEMCGAHVMLWSNCLWSILEWKRLDICACMNES